MTPMNGKWVGIGIMALGVLLFFTGYSLGYVNTIVGIVFRVLGGVGFISGITFMRVYWKCPSCDRFLFLGNWFAKRCCHCGKSLNQPRFKK